jgi:putative FmdB family regulatory protein
MPIYEYRCGDCGQQKDYLQKISDAPIDTCPACGSKAFSKAMSAAGFQLKGNGWYATDFKSGSTAKSAAATESSASAEPSKPEGSAKTESASASCSPGCACH